MMSVVQNTLKEDQQIFLSFRIPMVYFPTCLFCGDHSHTNDYAFGAIGISVSCPRTVRHAHCRGEGLNHQSSYQRKICAISWAMASLKIRVTKHWSSWKRWRMCLSPETLELRSSPSHEWMGQCHTQLSISWLTLLLVWLNTRSLMQHFPHTFSIPIIGHCMLLESLLAPYDSLNRVGWGYVAESLMCSQTVSV